MRLVMSTCRALGPLILVGGLAGAVSAGGGGSTAEIDQAGTRLVPMTVRADGVPTIGAAFRPYGGQGGVAGSQCPPEVVSHTDFNFQSGTVIIQQGLAESEIVAASYVVSDDEYPIIVRTAEIVFAQSHTNDTETHWSFLVWDGPPNSGILKAEYASDGSILPHLTMPAQGGATAVNIAVTVDPGDPDQILITNESGSNIVTIGFRVDQHNNQTLDPCFFPPPANDNAFPTTDVSGLSSPQSNWLWAINCGPFGCAAGWSTFSQLGACTPSGDWIMRLTYEPTGCAPGACCLPDGSCDIEPETSCTFAGGIFQGFGSECGGKCPQPGACCLPDGTCAPSSLVGGEDCAAAGGTYLGDDTTCATGECPDPLGACCFTDGSCTDGLNEPDCSVFSGIWQGAGSGCGGACIVAGACCFEDDTCVDGLTEEDCATFLGAFQGVGSDCAAVVCNPTGACCLPDGSCAEAVAPEECEALGGTFEGVGSLCVEVSCPQPLGACCAATGGCAMLLQFTCESIPGAFWGGPLTTCEDMNENGQPDGCEPDCPADIDQSGAVDVDDLVRVILDWAQTDTPADIDGSGVVDVDDLVLVILAWGPC